MFNSSFPKTTYNFYPNGINGPSADVKDVVDIMRRVRFLDTFGSIKNYKTYTIKTGETPDIVATKLYGDPSWYWLIMLFNNLTDPFTDWPRDGNDQVEPSVQEDTVSYLPGGTCSYDDLNPYNIGDQIVRVTDEGNFDEVNPYSSVITRIRPNMFSFDLSIPESTGIRLSAGEKYAVNSEDGTLSNINTVQRLDNPFTTAIKFQTDDGRDLSPFSARGTIDTPNEEILDPTAEGAPQTELTGTLIYEWIEGTQQFQKYQRTAIYQIGDRSDAMRNIKVFPNELKEAAHAGMVSLLEQKPSSGRTSVIRSANTNNLSLL